MEHGPCVAIVKKQNHVHTRIESTATIELGGTSTFRPTDSAMSSRAGVSPATRDPPPSRSLRILANASRCAATSRAVHTQPSRRREFCHFTDIYSPSILKHLLKGEGGAAE